MQTHSETVPYVAPQTPPPEAEQRVLLHGINWDTYERLLADLADRSVPHLTFDRGVLEIMSPTAEHEEHNRTLALLIEVVAEELQINIRSLREQTEENELSR